MQIHDTDIRLCCVCLVTGAQRLYPFIAKLKGKYFWLLVHISYLICVIRFFYILVHIMEIILKILWHQLFQYQHRTIVSPSPG